MASGAPDKENAFCSSRPCDTDTRALFVAYVGGTVGDVVENVPKITNGVLDAIKTAQRVPIPQIATPARTMYKALSVPVSVCSAAAA